MREGEGKKKRKPSDTFPTHKTQVTGTPRVGISPVSRTPQERFADCVLVVSFRSSIYTRSLKVYNDDVFCRPLSKRHDQTPALVALLRGSHVRKYPGSFPFFPEFTPSPESRARLYLAFNHLSCRNPSRNKKMFPPN